MQLGQIIRSFGDETSAAEALIACGDIQLLASVDAMTRKFNESTGEYASGAVRRFANLASSEDWLGLMSAIERTDDPARTVLVKMLRWALARDAAELSGSEVAACGCKGGAVGASHGPT